jgi:tRNA threonylcarbamoyladenosine biosynthesis protein TsaE
MKELLSIITNNENETMLVGEKLAKTVDKGVVCTLVGDLGAGKTHFVKGVARYFGLEGVTSPTYAYLNIYGNLLYHYDCYRLSCGEDAERLGLTDYFNGDNICLIEWAENIEDALPDNIKKVIIEKTSETERIIIL